MRRTVYSLLFVCVCSFLIGRAGAAVVINEVLANEPSSTTSLEWIELFNSSAEEVSLDGCYLAVGDRTIPFAAEDVIPGNGYYVVCRKLFSSAGEPSFESVWGDNSGIWGDSDLESDFPQPHEAVFSLPNSSGMVILYNSDDIILSQFEWTETGGDGVSWERVTASANDIAQSVDPLGCTPGFLNSVTPVNRDLAVDSVSVGSHEGVTDIDVTVINRSVTSAAYASLYLVIRDTTMPEIEDTVAFIALPEIAPGGNHVVSGSLNLDGEYVTMTAMLSDDDRIRNNRFDFVAPGSEFPALILSEAMINPSKDAGGEWVELFNRSFGHCDVSGWQLGDGASTYSIVSENLIVAAGDYLIVAEDSTVFSLNHPFITCPVVQLSGWPAFGSNADTIRLIGEFGIEADRYVYYSNFEEDYSHSRIYDNAFGGRWGRSRDVGGTPGEENEVVLTPTGDRVDIAVEKTHFTPDGDGVDDVLALRVIAPPDDSYTLRVFDRQGRIVRILFENEAYIPDEVIWDGLTDAGHRLPIGLYIVHFEAASAGSVKKAVVIAR